MKVLFVDHIFHAKTTSAQFFVDLLRDFFEVEVVYVDPDHPHEAAESLLNCDAETVVLWQLDYLAPFFLTLGRKTIVVPMYDGSALLPDLHWIWGNQATYINFSRRLHERILHVKGHSQLVRYFVAPVSRDELSDFNEMRVFLWQRRPEHGINVEAVERLLGDQIHSLHIHDAPDDHDLNTAGFFPKSPSYKLTRSRWVDDPKIYKRILSTCNVFFAPRRSEGIGLAMLEALGRGMLVIASDAPTHDEYISNWLNGILFNPDNTGYAHVSSVAKEIGYMAWQGVRDGHRQWLEATPKIIDAVKRAHRPTGIPKNDPSELLHGLMTAYNAGLNSYRSYLLSHVDLIAKYAPKDLFANISTSGELQSVVHRRRRTDIVNGSSLSWLDQNRLTAATLLSGKHIISGRVEHAEGTAWIVGHGIHIGFRIDAELGVTNRLHFSYRRPIGSDLLNRVQKLCLILNGWTLWNDVISDADGTIEVPIPPYVIRPDNILQIQSDGMYVGQAGLDPVSIGVERLSLE